MRQIIVITGEQCAVCRTLIRRLEKQRIEFFEIDMRNASGFISKYGIRSIPTSILADEEEINNIILSGYSNKIFNQIKQFWLRIENNRNRKLRYGW